MQSALVIGRATATIRHQSLEGRRLVIVLPLMADGATADGDPLLAIDAVGVGQGDTAIITSDGLSARTLLNVEATPVRWTVIGVADRPTMK